MLSLLLWYVDRVFTGCGGSEGLGKWGINYAINSAARASMISFEHPHWVHQPGTTGEMRQEIRC